MSTREITKMTVREAAFAWFALVVLLFMVRCFMIDVAAMF